jgi:hypothetical protein
MRKALLTLATATILSAGILADHAAATISSMGSSSTATAGQSLVREAAIVCGGSGCNPVQTKARQKRKLIPLGSHS